MGIRRTREQKIKAQQHRVEPYTWQENKEISVKNKPTKSSPLPSSTPNRSSQRVSPLPSFLRQDLSRTVLATLVVIGLLAVVWLMQ